MAGRARTLTVVTELRPFGTTVLRISFAVTRRLPAILGIAPLRSIYSTRWTLVPTLPSGGTGRRVRPSRPYLLWESDYSAAMEPYIESFISAIGKRIAFTWASSYGFPGTRSVTRLREYIESTSLPPGCTYSAYPDQSAAMVLSSLAVSREHPFLLDAARDGTDEEFAVLYRGFLRRRQGDL